MNYGLANFVLVDTDSGPSWVLQTVNAKVNEASSQQLLYVLLCTGINYVQVLTDRGSSTPWIFQCKLQFLLIYAVPHSIVSVYIRAHCSSVLLLCSTIVAMWIISCSWHCIIDILRRPPRRSISKIMDLQLTNQIIIFVTTMI